MNPEVFFENFELLADAPNGIQKLRELILQLAVMGKLVEQDPKDEPAYVLVEKIKAKKKVVKRELKDKSQASLTVESKKLSLPSSWVLVRLGDIIYSILGGGTPSKIKPEYWEGDIPWASVKDLGKRKYLENTIDKITELGLKQSNTNLIPKGWVIVCTRMGLGKIAINKMDVAINQDLKALHLFEEINLDYFYNFYLTLNITGNGMTVKGIRQEDLLNILVPLPPLAEQKHIVAKVDELMALCDKLEAHRQKKQELQSKLNSAALDRMLSAENQEEFEQHWQRICQNFDLLYDNPENVEKLRQAILQLAVQGKLVEQNPEDEPANVLIEKIDVEKRLLVKAGKIKNSKSSSIIRQNETDQNKMICCLPAGWEWIRLEDLGEFCGGGTPSTNNLEYWGGNIAWVSPKDMKESIIKRSEMKITEKALEETRIRLIPKNSILIVARSGILKRLLPVSINDIECTVNQDLKVIVPFYPEISNYIQLMLKGYESFILKHLVKGGMTVQSLKYTEFEKYPFPIPPLAEQKRIVEKVDQLMGLCDELEAKLRKEREDSEKLVEAVVKGLLESAVAGKSEKDERTLMQAAVIQLK